MLKKQSLKFAPVHPGEILQDALDAAGLSQSALAVHIGVTQSKVNDITEKYIEEKAAARSTVMSHINIWLYLWLFAGVMLPSLHGSDAV